MISKKNIQYIVLLVLLSIFLILKMERGFSDTEEAGGLWNIIQLIFVVGGLVCLYSNIHYRNFVSNNIVIKIYLIFAFYIWFFSFFVYFSDNVYEITSTFNFVMIPYGALTMYFFYTVGSKIDIRKYPLILVSTYVIIFIILFASMRGLLPLIFVYTPQKIAVFPYIIAFLAVIMTGKRTGFLVLAAILLIYFVSFYREKSIKNIIIKFGILIIVLFTVYYLGMNFIEKFNLDMLDRLEHYDEGGAAVRLERWGIIGENVMSSNYLQLIFGHGYKSVLKLTGGHAHNDFLEVLYDYGIIALALYLMFYISFFIEGLKMYKKNYIYAREFMCSFAVAIFLASFSFYLADCTFITCNSVCIGLMLADWDNKKQLL